MQWFLFSTLFPLFLVGWTAVTGSDFGDLAYLFAIYFAMTWGLVIWLFVQPERIGMFDSVRVSLFTAFMGVFPGGPARARARAGAADRRLARRRAAAADRRVHLRRRTCAGWRATARRRTSRTTGPGATRTRFGRTT